MFDIGWSEMMVVGVVALIVVGPKDLPRMFHTLGEFTGKARGMSKEQVIKDVEAYLRREVGGDFEFLPPWLTGLTLSDHNNHELADGLMESIKQVVGERKKVGVPYGTNASRTSAVGVPSVVFGPGSILQAHTRDEWISIEQLEQASEIYYRYCAGG